MNKDTMRVIILIPMLLAVLFAGLFGWAIVHNTKVRSECVKIRLITNATEATPINGLFIDGIECKFETTISETCKPYYESVPECPRNTTRRRLGTDKGDSFENGGYEIAWEIWLGEYYKMLGEYDKMLGEYDKIVGFMTGWHII